MSLFWMVNGAVQRDNPIAVTGVTAPRAVRDTEIDGVVSERGRGRRSSADPAEQVKVAEVMTRGLYTLKETESVDDALTLLEDRGIHHVPVVDEDGMLVGLVSDRDLLRCLDFLEEPLSRFMTRRLVVSRPSTGLKDAARVLMIQKISSLPVVDAELRPVGLVTMADILGYLVSHPAMELWS